MHRGMLEVEYKDGPRIHPDKTNVVYVLAVEMIK